VKFAANMTITWLPDIFLAIVVILPLLSCFALQEASPVSRRRALIENGLKIGSTVGSAWFLLPQPAFAARGAAELDFEFYMRDLFGGNKKEGNIQASASRVILPPRRLEGPLLPLLLDDKCSPACIPTQALIQQIKQRDGGDERVLAEDIQSRVQAYRDKTARSFSSRAPWNEEHVSDQYYFDLTAYALWRSAADLLPNYLDRDKFSRNVGRLILAELQAEKLVGKVPIGKSGVLVSAIPATMEVLELFKSSRYCKDFIIRGEDNKENDDFVFDEIDDESVAAGGTADCLVSVYEPSTLGASLQITGEQSRFGPDFVGATLAALWEANGIRSSWETFFVDPEYRPNPKDFFPNEQLFQFTLSKK
jgi:hypothetical protein